ncbi:hypothetical protein D3C85_1661210 [compost metagenome]
MHEAVQVIEIMQAAYLRRQDFMRLRVDAGHFIAGFAIPLDAAPQVMAQGAETHQQHTLLVMAAVASGAQRRIDGNAHAGQRQRRHAEPGSRP